METLLQGVQDAHAHTVLVDVTGVRTIDTHTAGSLLRVSQSVRLLGAQVILTGLRPEVAQTLVSLGVDVSGLFTMATLQSAIARTLRKNPALTRK
jgi:anti-anti-sigma regulatory factor